MYFLSQISTYLNYIPGAILSIFGLNLINSDIKHRVLKNKHTISSIIVAIICFLLVTASSPEKINSIWFWYFIFIFLLSSLATFYFFKFKLWGGGDSKLMLAVSLAAVIVNIYFYLVVIMVLSFMIICYCIARLVVLGRAKSVPLGVPIVMAWYFCYVGLLVMLFYYGQDAHPTF